MVYVISLQGRPATLKCKFCTSVSLNEVVILQQKLANIFCNISFIFVHNTVFTVQKKCCCVMLTFYNISKLCSAMFHCSANALSSMLQGTAFYLIHKFAHTLKFQDDAVLNIAKVYANMYIFTSQ